jgi:hypothetical protein
MQNPNVYTNDQGKGLATTFQTTAWAQLALQNRRAEGAARAQQRKSSIDKMTEFKPQDVWHYFSADAQKAFEGWVQSGAEIMADQGISDLWSSPNPEAIKWQLQGARLKQAQSNISQAQKNYEEAIKDIGTRGDKYSEEYIQAVKDFPVNTSFDKIVSGEFNFPVAKFNDPGSIYQNFFVQGINELKGATDGDVVPDGQFVEKTKLFFAAPENKAEVRAAQQLFGDLPEPVQTEYKSLAERKGLEFGWQAYMYDGLKKQYAPPTMDITASAVDAGRLAPTDFTKWTKEDTKQVTKGGEVTKLADSDYPIRRAKGFFGKNAYLLDDEDAMASLGVSMDVPRNERRVQAEAAYAEIVRDNIPERRVSSLTRGGTGSGFGDDEIMGSYDKWRAQLESNDQRLANEAANYLFGIKSPDGASAVIGSHVKDFSPSGIPAGDRKLMRLDPDMNIRVVAVQYKDEQSAQKAKEKYYKELGGGEALQGEAIIETGQGAEPDGNKQLLDYYDKLSTGSVVYYPLKVEQEQVLKQLHREAVKEQGALFSPTGYKYDKPKTPAAKREITPQEQEKWRGELNLEF